MTNNMDDHCDKRRKYIYLDVDASPGSIDYELLQIIKSHILSAAEEIKGRNQRVTYERLSLELKKHRRQISRWVEFLGLREKLGLRKYSKS